MDVKTLYTLVAIADHGSFGDAGRVVGLSTSGVSLQVRALEDELGVTLFDRSTRPPRLTDQGQDFVRRAREVITVWENLSDSLKRDATRGVLRVGAVHTSVLSMVPPALARLQRRCPDLHIHLMTGLTHDLEDSLKRGTLDAAVVSRPDAIDPALRYRAFTQEPLAVIAHESLEGQTDRELLERHPYVRFNRFARVARIVEAEFARRNIAISSRMEVDTLEGVVRLVGSLLGVSVVPVPGVGVDFPPEIRAVPFGEPEVLRELGLLEPAVNARAHFCALLYDELAAVTGGTAENGEAEGNGAAPP
ncbi:MAG: LysR family transcriptional regulator [Dichotomicrobium sp.]